MNYSTSDVFIEREQMKSCEMCKLPFFSIASTSLPEFGEGENFAKINKKARLIEAKASSLLGVLQRPNFGPMETLTM